MENNLELNKTISFKEFIQHGMDNGANIVNGMPWSWKINGKSVTQENDYCYIVETIFGSEKFYNGDLLVAHESGLRILKTFSYDTHAPGGCPM
jgi:hypothetical protein